METVEGLLGTVRAEAPDFHVASLRSAPASLATGDRWALIAVARGRVDVLGVVLDPGDAVLARGRGAVPARSDDATVVTARFGVAGTARRLVPLPDAVVVRADSELCRLLIGRLADQVGPTSVGDAVSARLLDWLVTSTVRDVLVAATPSGAVSDPGVSAALVAIHERPAHAWTVAELARRSGVGRAAFARRFRDAVGTSPLSYVREHRLELAERALLAEPGTTVAAVARRVGYANPYSFSTAFRRHRGVAPSELRERSSAAV